MGLGDHLKDEQKKTTLLKSKMADTVATMDWYSGVVDSDEVPNSIEEWKKFMNEYFDVNNLITRARSNFKNIEMLPQEQAATFTDRFKTARLKADFRDNKEMGERLVDGLNEHFVGTLSFKSFYAK